MGRWCHAAGTGTPIVNNYHLGAAGRQGSAGQQQQDKQKAERAEGSLRRRWAAGVDGGRVGSSRRSFELTSFSSRTPYYRACAKEETWEMDEHERMIGEAVTRLEVACLVDFCDFALVLGRLLFGKASYRKFINVWDACRLQHYITKLLACMAKAYLDMTSTKLSKYVDILTLSNIRRIKLLEKPISATSGQRISNLQCLWAAA